LLVTQLILQNCPIFWKRHIHGTPGAAEEADTSFSSWNWMIIDVIKNKLLVFERLDLRNKAQIFTPKLIRSILLYFYFKVVNQPIKITVTLSWMVQQGQQLWSRLIPCLNLIHLMHRYTSTFIYCIATQQTLKHGTSVHSAEFATRLYFTIYAMILTIKYQDS
jgi:hypothetical protein